MIINEFGDLGVDGDLLQGCGIENCAQPDVVELTNGCICCTVADDFIPTMSKLLERVPGPDHIVIETSGLALPGPLVNAFNWPEIREQVTVDGVVTVVDSRAVADGQFADDVAKINAQRARDAALDHESSLEQLFEDQLSCADMVVLNKADLVDGETLAKVEQEVGAKVPPAVKMVRASHGALGAQVLLGLEAVTQKAVDNHKSHHHTDHDHTHDHDEFVSFVVGGGAATNKDVVARQLATLIGQHDILRLKGFVAIKDKPMRLVVQAVGKRVACYFDRAWQAGEPHESRLIVIGLKGGDEGQITADIKALLG